MMNDDNDKVFSDAMSDVQPLKREPRAGLHQSAQSKRDASLTHRRQAAAEVIEGERNKLTDTGIAPLDAWFVLSFKRPRGAERGFSEVQAGSL